MKRFLTKLAVSAPLLLCIWATSGPLQAQVAFQLSGDHVAININGSPFSDFYIGSAYPKPFLWPLRSATGLVVTRNFPMATVPGESHDHPHHRGLFIGYGEINGVNFWENERTYKTENRGTIVIRKLQDLKGGKKSGTLRAQFEWHDPGGANVMDENRTMTFYSDADRRVIDFDITFVAKINLQWADTKEGFFAIRLADSIREQNGGLMVNSEGASGEKNVWGKQASWVDYTGKVDGQPAGVAILAHPSNPKYPPRWHARAYGLFAVNPFGYKQFIGEKEGPGGGLQMTAGQSMRLRYRVIIHGSEINSLNLPDIYQDYLKQVKK